jgi:DNA-binding PadR family transcriptional regulator
MARKPARGPASDPELLVLSSLAEGPKHGYAIMEDIAMHAGVEMGPGTLYGAITRLVENGWVAPLEARGRQRPYRLTGKGAEHLKAQLESMRQLAAFGLRRLRTI